MVTTFLHFFSLWDVLAACHLDGHFGGNTGHAPTAGSSGNNSNQVRCPRHVRIDGYQHFSVKIFLSRPHYLSHFPGKFVKAVDN